ncbi:hypothetical protein Acsp03_64590 [Actinomadura sp. NBRC 104412]|nr:hypothetical protein Acsp03_64590 [Actinomadura sp. NBRC 104412]
MLAVPVRSESCRGSADALSEPADAVLCADGPVGSLVELSLVGEHRWQESSLGVR